MATCRLNSDIGISAVSDPTSLLGLSHKTRHLACPPDRPSGQRTGENGRARTGENGENGDIPGSFRKPPKRTRLPCLPGRERRGIRDCHDRTQFISRLAWSRRRSVRADVPRDQLDSEGRATLDDLLNAQFRLAVVGKDAWDNAMLAFAQTMDKEALFQVYVANPPVQ